MKTQMTSLGRTCIIAAVLALPLTACTFFDNHRLDTQQGNILKPKTVDRIHLGMSKKQVVYILGTPVKTNTFNADRFEYVYTFKTAYKAMEIKQINITFSQGKVINIQRG